MDKKIMTKLLASMLAFILTFTNIALLGIYAGETLAVSNNLETQDTNVNKANIEFDAYFQEEGEIQHEKDIDVKENDDKLYLNLKVSDGYLANGKIKLENSNFTLAESEGQLELVQGIDVEKGEIILNQIDKGESVILEIPIKMKTDSLFNVTDLNKISKVILEGTYINEAGKDISISKAIEVKANMIAKEVAKLTSEVSKYVQFNLNGEKGVVLQETIKSNLEDNVLPVKQTQIEIEIPKINGEVPKTVVLSSISTKATDGKGGRTFEEGKDYTFEEGKILLTINNEQNEEGKVSWIKNSQDEIILTCVYGEKAITANANVNFVVNSKITSYSEEEVETVANVNEEKALTKKVGEIMSYGISTKQDSLNKGYMLVSGADNTPYVDTWTANIGCRELVDNVVLENKANYLDEDENIYPSNPVYTYTKISYENFLGILGEEGYINIYDKNGEKIAVLNKDNLEYKYEKETTYIKVETSKPISEGMLSIENGRAVKPLEYSKEQEELFTKVKVEVNGKSIQNGNNILVGKDSAQINLTNPTEQSTLVLSKNNISTVKTNEGVELRVTLKTTDTSTVLYKNPTIEIVFPKYITNIKATNVRLVYEDELKHAGATMFVNENGNKVIRIKLQGEQTKFNKEAQTEGATLIMNLDITADELTPARTENIEMYVSNELTGKTIKVETPVKFTPPAGIVTINQITNFNNEGAKATSISGKKETGEIQAKTGARQATVNMTMINNYQYNCENIVILGRTPFIGNKDILTGKELESTFTAEMVSSIQAISGIDADQIKVYYSANGEANKDLNDAQNGWTMDVSNLSEVKSFMIVLNDYAIKTGDIITFNYNVEIPEDLSHNQETYGIFAVYYTKQNTEEIATFSLREVTQQVATATKVGVTTGEGPNLEITLTANPSNEIESWGTITYTAKVTNKASKKVDNVYLKLDIPSNARYVDEKGNYIDSKDQKTVEIPVGSIEANSSKDIKFNMRAYSYNLITDFDEDGNIITNDKIAIKVTAGVKGYVTSFASNEVTNIIKEQSIKPNINLRVSSANSPECRPGRNMDYELSILQNTMDGLNNVVITCKIPDGLTFISTTQEGRYDESTKTITWKYDKLKSAESITLVCKINDLPSNVYQKESAITFYATCDESDKTFESNTFTTKAVGEGFTISQTSNISDEYISSGQEITYAISVKNLGGVSTSATVTDYLPKGLSFIQYQYTQNGKITSRTKNSGQALEIPVALDAGETLVIYVRAKAKEINTASQEITNKVKLSSALVENLEANEITHKIIGTNYKPEDPENPDNPSGEVTKTYKISGTAWLDDNKNGQRDSEEKLLSNINVYLLDSETNKVVAKAETNNNGVYEFTKIDSGKYVVVFEYDTANYNVTTYQAEGVDQTVNSDVINMMLTLNGKTAKYAATNTILVSTNMYNIDLGIAKSPKFDLELTKGISLVQVSNSKESKNYKFENTDLAKVEIPSKTMNGSVVAITYTFTIENKGAVDGYVKKLVDYIPKDLNFNSTLNPEWYQDTDGNLYNTSLANTVIKPGEKIEASLVLTKTMTGENTGIVNNTAEICEASNDLGITDIDSTPGNKNANEDDYGKADIIITVKTGGAVTYIGIVITVLAIFALGAYGIKKKVLTRI